MAEEYYGLHKQLIERFGKEGDAAYTFVSCLLAIAIIACCNEIDPVSFTLCHAALAGVQHLRAWVF